MSIAFGPRPPRRRASLTPMIDVVFLLLIFFMLAAQIGRDAAVPLAAGGGGSPYSGPPRLVEIAPRTVSLNGQTVLLEALPARLARLTAAPSDTVVLRPVEGARLQRLIDVAQALRAGGFTTLVVVE